MSSDMRRDWPDDFINKVICGDCVEIMAGMEADSVDAIVTDPPYGLEFMGKEWDKLEKIPKGYIECKSKNSIIKKRMPRFHQTVEHNSSMQLWHAQWLTEAYRVLKPGGSALVMGGTRTFHRLACAMEDTGFIIKDCLMWIYGSGFPKAQDLGKMIDKRAGVEREIVGEKIYADGKPRPNIQTSKGCNEGWKRPSHAVNYSKEPRLDSAPSTPLAQHWDGFKIGGIKPAYEPILWAVKPPEGSYIDNVLKWGVGAVNVDECRVKGDYKCDGGPPGFTADKGWHPNSMVKLGERKTKGRFPANVILDEEAGRALDEQSGVRKSHGGGVGTGKGCNSTNNIKYGGGLCTVDHSIDSGGASRFFYCAKASRGERGKDNTHPTVKPISLMSWLIQLITRKGQTVLDPFLGSGTIAIAAKECRRKFIGIEREADYVEMAEKRLFQGVL